jgi:integrase
MLAATGMRLSEAFEIDGEMKERGCRYIIVGRKKSQSLRRVPLPAAVLPLLPRNRGVLDSSRWSSRQRRSAGAFLSLPFCSPSDY